MATSAQIISFGSWRSPTPANTVEGRFYLRLKARLSVGKRRLLQTMEKDLFNGAALCADSAGVLKRPERVHTLPGLGYIAYFWSRADQLYVLSEFGFEDSDAGGGLPCGSRSPSGPCGGLAKPASRPIAVAARAIATAFRSARGAAAELRWCFGIFSSSALPTAKLVAPWRRGMGAGRGSSVELASEVLAVHALLAGNGPLDRTELPRWSLLRELVTVPEELRNPLARSLVASELICRLGSVADDTWRATSRCSWPRFLSRADGEWPVPLDWRVHEDPTWLGALIAAWLSDDAHRDVDGDALRLLARARLSVVLASHVRRAASEADVPWAYPESIAIAAAKQHVLHKIHLVSEYVSLSYSVWLADHHGCVWGDGEDGNDARTVFKEFDRSVEIIARQMNRAGRPTSGTFRDRISTIAMEIVASGAVTWVSRRCRGQIGAGRHRAETATRLRSCCRTVQTSPNGAVRKRCGVRQRTRIGRPPQHRAP